MSQRVKGHDSSECASSTINGTAYAVAVFAPAERRVRMAARAARRKRRGAAARAPNAAYVFVRKNEAPQRWRTVTSNEGTARAVSARPPVGHPRKEEARMPVRGVDFSTRRVVREREARREEGQRRVRVVSPGTGSVPYGRPQEVRRSSRTYAAWQKSSNVRCGMRAVRETMSRTAGRGARAGLERTSEANNDRDVPA